MISANNTKLSRFKCLSLPASPCSNRSKLLSSSMLDWSHMNESQNFSVNFMKKLERDYFSNQQLRLDKNNRLDMAKIKRDLVKRRESADRQVIYYQRKGVNSSARVEMPPKTAESKFLKSAYQISRCCHSPKTPLTQITTASTAITW